MKLRLEDTPLSEIPITDLVPLEERERAEYRTILREMKQNLRNPDKVFRYATHEAGHFIYLKKTKLVSSVNDYVYRGPMIYFEDGTIKYFYAGVDSQRVRLSDDNLEYTGKLLAKLAFVAAAGTVFETLLLGGDEDAAKASGGDEIRLHDFCYKAMVESGIEYRKFTLWPSAYKRVTKYVQKNRPKLDPKVREARKTILEKCFGLDATLFRTPLIDFFLDDTTH